MKNLSEILKCSPCRNLDQNNAQSAVLQAAIFKSKKPLRNFYARAYREMIRLRERYAPGVQGLEIEIGGGGGFFKEIRPQALTTDIKPVPGLDRVLDAREFPDKSQSVAAIYAFHCLHHIPEIRKFFAEAVRVLKPGGAIVAIEPYWSPLAKFLFTHCHEEPFDDKAVAWEFPSTGPMSGANQALSYLVLKRDHAQFKTEFPKLELSYRRSFGFLEYIATGGIWRPQLAPDFLFGLLHWMDDVLLAPLMPALAIHHIFVLNKK